jgi:hypothetical protein
LLGRTIRDDDGMELLSLEAARLESARTAAEMLRDRTQEKAGPPTSVWSCATAALSRPATVVVALKLQ